MPAETQLKLPGFGLPLDAMPKDHQYGTTRFPHAIADYFATDGVTIREQTMLEFMSQITDKPMWTEKIYDDTIVEKWRQEACGTKKQQEFSDAHLSMACFDFCLAELRDKVEYFEEHGVVHVLDVAATIVKTDLAEGDDFTAKLSQAVYPLEHIPDLHKDWHPGSDGLVLDIVHPSLFPLRYGKTRVLPYGTVLLDECSEWIGCGQVCPIPEHVSNNADFERDLCNFTASLKPWGSYQWLPSDVQFEGDGKAKLMSYVNNLHPQRHRDLYRVLELAVDKALPLWNECLSFFHDRLRIKVDSVGYEDYRDRLLTMADLAALRVTNVDGRTEEDQHNSDNTSSGEENDDDEDSEDDNEDSQDEDEQRVWVRDNPDKREISQPDPQEEYVPFSKQVQNHELHRRDLSSDFPDGLQVIFKLANIHLTPDKPRYNGSDWHVEGALNEHICATALFYYDQENIDDSYLEFRCEIDSETMIMKPGQDEYETCEDLYGIAQNEAAIQDIGKVSTRKGRILAFPNVMQHRVRPFSLADPTKPGHRKILAIFLVDPHIRILSTANVPPQRRDWWTEEVRKVDPFAGLPVELFERIIEEVEDFPISWGEACEMREELMAERGRARDEFEEALAQDTFFFCEH